VQGQRDEGVSAGATRSPAASSRRAAPSEERPGKILVVDDQRNMRTTLAMMLRGGGYEVDEAADGAEGREQGATGAYDVVITDLRMGEFDGIEVLRAVKEAHPMTEVIVMTAYGTIDNAVEAMKLGAFDFIQKPLDVDHLILLLRRCREHRELLHENLLLKEEFQTRYGLPSIIGESPSIVGVSQSIQRVAPTDSTVLLQGESGTGKELFARAIHQLSARRNRPFVAINCAAIPDTLIENELFGHEKGSFTGATARQLGKFELADSGTIFLDEIGDLGSAVQSKLLRVLQERSIERIGGTSSIDVDVRVICATNRNLADDVKSGRFREDLFFRVNVFPVTIPPLRARKEDVDALTDFFLQRFARELGKPSLRISDAARAALRAHDWPGNIRELENCIERAAILCDQNTIESRDLSLVASNDPALFDFSGSLAEVTDRMTRLKIQDALQRSNSRTEAADILGIAPRTLAAKMKELGLE